MRQVGHCGFCKNKGNQVGSKKNQHKTNHFSAGLFAVTEPPDSYKTSDTKTIYPCHVLKTEIGITVTKIEPAGKAGHNTCAQDDIYDLAEPTAAFYPKNYQWPY